MKFLFPQELFQLQMLTTPLFQTDPTEKVLALKKLVKS